MNDETELEPEPILYLTQREKEFLELISDGLQYKEIGEILGVKTQTVKNTLAKARDRNQCLNNEQLIKMWLRP